MYIKNNQEIARFYGYTLDHLATKQNNYEKMLEDEAISKENRDIILNHLMEVDYQIRDYSLTREEALEAEGAIYFDKDAFMPIIKDGNILTRIVHLDVEAEMAEIKLDEIINRGELRSEQGKNALTKLYYIDHSQKQLIDYELNKYYNRIDKLTTLKNEKRVYALLNQIEEIKKAINYNCQRLYDMDYPKYKNDYLRNIITQFNIDNRLMRLRKKEGKITKKVNRIISKSNNKVKTLKLNSNVPLS